MQLQTGQFYMHTIKTYAVSIGINKNLVQSVHTLSEYNNNSKDPT